MSAKKWQTWVWVKWKPGASSTAWESWKDNPAILNAWSTLGDWDCCLHVNINDPDKLEDFVWKTLKTNQWVESTSTTWAKQWW